MDDSVEIISVYDDGNEDEVFIGPVTDAEIKAKEMFEQILKNNVCQHDSASSGSDIAVAKTNVILYKSFPIDDGAKSASGEFASFDDSLEIKIVKSKEGTIEDLKSEKSVSHDIIANSENLYDSLEDICSLVSSIEKCSISDDKIEAITDQISNGNVQINSTQVCLEKMKVNISMIPIHASEGKPALSDFLEQNCEDNLKHSGCMNSSYDEDSLNVGKNMSHPSQKLSFTEDSISYNVHTSGKVSDSSSHDGVEDHTNAPKRSSENVSHLEKNFLERNITIRHSPLTQGNSKLSKTKDDSSINLQLAFDEDSLAIDDKSSHNCPVGSKKKILSSYIQNVDDSLAKVDNVHSRLESSSNFLAEDLFAIENTKAPVNATVPTKLASETIHSWCHDVDMEEDSLAVDETKKQTHSQTVIATAVAESPKYSMNNQANNEYLISYGNKASPLVASKCVFAKENANSPNICEALPMNVPVKAINSVCHYVDMEEDSLAEVKNSSQAVISENLHIVAESPKYNYANNINHKTKLKNSNGLSNNVELEEDSLKGNASNIQVKSSLRAIDFDDDSLALVDAGKFFDSLEDISMSKYIRVESSDINENIDFDKFTNDGVTNDDVGTCSNNMLETSVQILWEKRSDDSNSKRMASLSDSAESLFFSAKSDEIVSTSEYASANIHSNNLSESIDIKGCQDMKPNALMVTSKVPIRNTSPLITKNVLPVTNTADSELSKIIVTENEKMKYEHQEPNRIENTCTNQEQIIENLSGKIYYSPTSKLKNSKTYKKKESHMYPPNISHEPCTTHVSNYVQDKSDFNHWKNKNPTQDSKTIKSEIPNTEDKIENVDEESTKFSMTDLMNALDVIKSEQVNIEGQVNHATSKPKRDISKLISAVDVVFEATDQIASLLKLGKSDNDNKEMEYKLNDLDTVECLDRKIKFATVTPEASTPPQRSAWSSDKIKKVSEVRDKYLKYIGVSKSRPNFLLSPKSTVSKVTTKKYNSKTPQLKNKGNGKISHSPLEQESMLQALDLHDTFRTYRKKSVIQSRDSIMPLNLCIRDNIFTNDNFTSTVERSESKENIPIKARRLVTPGQKMKPEQAKSSGKTPVKDTTSKKPHKPTPTKIPVPKSGNAKGFTPDLNKHLPKSLSSERIQKGPSLMKSTSKITPVRKIFSEHADTQKMSQSKHVKTPVHSSLKFLKSAEKSVPHKLQAKQTSVVKHMTATPPDLNLAFCSGQSSAPSSTIQKRWA